VRPFYRIDERKRPEVVGSGVLVRVGDIYAIFSAAHVTDWRKHGRLALLGERGTAEPLGELIETEPPNGIRDDDRLDIGIFLLTDEERERLGNIDFVQIDKDTLRDGSQLDSLTHPAYEAIGWPLSRQNRRGKSLIVRPQPMAWAASDSSDSDYHEMMLSRSDHVILPFDKQRVVGSTGIVVAPSPTGMSGGGLWRYQPFGQNETRIGVLIGINIEWHRNTRKRIVATRLSRFCEALHEKHPEVADILGSPPY
jgi:hypothetical protein